MTEQCAKAIKEAADVIGLDVEHNEKYSGRSMYGKTTHGIVTDNFSHFIQATAYAAATIVQQEDNDPQESGYVDVDYFLNDLRDIKTDSMGRTGVIYY